MTTITPRGWQRDEVQHRFATTAPASYDAESRSAECIISVGTAVQRAYGSERLRITRDAVNTSRVHEGGIPLLNSHGAHDIKNVLGRIAATWIKDGVLWGKIIFGETPEAKRAEEMVARGELRSVSAGYSVEKWRVADAEGNPVDPDQVRWSDSDLVFTAEKWTVVEVSLVATPADQKAVIRSLGDNVPAHIRNTRARMRARQRMFERMRK